MAGTTVLHRAAIELYGDDKKLISGMASARRMTQESGKELEKVADDVSKKFDVVGQHLTNVGAGLTAGVTLPIMAAGVLVTVAADRQIQAETRLTAAIAAAGGQVDKELSRFKAYAAGLQEVTIVGDEATLANIQVARSMGLGADGSARAAKNAVALAAAFGINERSAIRYTAALEQGDTTMLNRYIPTLRNIEDQGKRVAEAQKILAGAFDVAKASAERGSGPLKQFRNDLGDLQEQFGTIVFDGINPFIQELRKGVKALQDIPEPTKRVIVGVAGLAATIGPALIGVGLFTKALRQWPTLLYHVDKALIGLKTTSGGTLLLLAVAAAAYAKFAAAANKAEADIDESTDAIIRASEALDPWMDKINRLKTVNHEVFQDFKAKVQELRAGGMETSEAWVKAWKEVGAATILAAADVEKAAKQMERSRQHAENYAEMLLVAAENTKILARHSKGLQEDLPDAIELPPVDPDAYVNSLLLVRANQETLKRHLQEDMEDLPDYITVPTEKLESKFSDAGKESGRALVEGIVKGVGANELWERVLNIFEDRLLGEIYKMFKIASPSKVFEQVGGNLVLGLERGIASGMGAAAAAFGSIIPTQVAMSPAAMSSPASGMGGVMVHQQIPITIQAIDRRDVVAFFEENRGLVAAYAMEGITHSEGAMRALRGD